MSGGLQGRPAAAPPRRYLAVGHVTVDVVADGEHRPGGSVLYSALQASRLGLAATILTRGDAEQLEAMLRPFRDEVELIVQPADATTTLATSGTGEERRQRLLSWAGPVELGALPEAEILHLAPVAAELAGSAEGEWEFVGLTPQGLARRWEEPGGEIVACDADPAVVAMAGRCDAIVLSASERASCAELIERGLAAGATVAITAGADATELLYGPGRARRMATEPIAGPLDDLGAGDVYAAAFFAQLAAGDDRVGAARLAHRAAALRMQGVGPDAVATAAEIGAWAGATKPPVA